jgi:hypothetical protein
VTAQDTFKLFLAEELRPDFKARGFRQKGLTFYLTVEDNFAIVQFQKSRSATAGLLDFTINDWARAPCPSYAVAYSSRSRSDGNIL